MVGNKFMQAKKIKIWPTKSLSGELSIPGDKSISHRALMFSSLALGTSSIENLLEGHDCFATLQLMRALGVHIELKAERWLVHGQGRFSLTEPSSILDCKNSGTTIRLMSGLLSAMPFMSILDGTEQIKMRPMARVVEPLRAMGAQIFGRQENRLAPLVCVPSTLLGTKHELKLASAQVKSALILAALFAKGPSFISGAKASRNHTELMLRHMGASIEHKDDGLTIEPLKKDLEPINIKVPGDISSAAFLLVAAALKAEEGVVLKEVGVNESRTGLIDAMKIMGAKIELKNIKDVAGEAVADLWIKSSPLHGASFGGDHIVRMIDEIPVLALLATQVQGTTVIKDAAELKVKESNRIAKTVELLSALGADIEELPDGMRINGPCQLRGGELSSYGDHRLGMMASIAGLLAKEPVVVHGAEVSDDSFPGFYKSLATLGAKVEVQSHDR